MRQRVAPPAPIGEVEGLFGPGSVSWQVTREAALLVGGGRAILLQIAHPLVAAGVAEHSRFQTETLSRLQRTLDTMQTIVFGDRPQALAALRRLHTVHLSVRGALPHTTGAYPAGLAYTAQDPVLKLWVHATLTDTSFLVYEQFVGPLTPDERVRGYEESKALARYMGIPASIMPPTLDAFDDYMRAMLDGDTLVVDDTARALARAVFWPSIWFGPRLAAWALGRLTPGFLPPHLREAYGMPWNARRQAALDLLARAVRRALPLTPGLLRYTPQARAARRRVGRW